MTSHIRNISLRELHVRLREETDDSSDVDPNVTLRRSELIALLDTIEELRMDADYLDDRVDRSS